MKQTFLTITFTSAALFLTSCDQPETTDKKASAEKDQWTNLFDGKTTDGWKNPYEWGEIEVVDGELHLTGDKKFFLVTEKTYSDFVFEGDILLPEGTANSGFMFRAHVKPNKVFGYQTEVDGSPRNWSGGLYDEGRRQWFISPKRGDKESEAAFRERAGDTFKRNDWNTYRITCKGNHLKVEVNGVVTTDIKDDEDASGVIGIQHHGEKGQTYRFRNLRIKELK
ncbi:MAG: 3-keto-disaccharide hydrolase [Akkermansiaceae bacterium]